MYSVVTATENETINNDLKNTQKYNVMYSDIFYQEALLEIVKDKNVDKVVIYENLPGDKKKEDFFKELVLIKGKTDIIVIVDKINDKIKEFFNNIGIYKLIDSRNITIENIIKAIDMEFKNETDIFSKNIEIKKEKSNIEYNKKIITINGGNGAGKTTVAINLAIAIAKNTDKKVLIIDLDTIGANVENFLNIPIMNIKKDIDLDVDKQCVLNYFTECIQKNIFDFDIFQNGVIKYKNIDVITGNTSMFVCQNVLCEKYYDIILKKAKDLYGYIIIDTNSNLFLDSTKWAIERSDITYYVLEGTYRDLKSLKNNMIIFSKSWDIMIRKIELIINKKTNYSLDKHTIKSIFNNEIREEFEYNQDYIKALNNGIPVVELNKNILNLYERIIGKKEEKNKILKLLGGKIIDNKSIKNK